MFYNFKFISIPEVFQVKYVRVTEFTGRQRDAAAYFEHIGKYYK